MCLRHTCSSAGKIQILNSQGNWLDCDPGSVVPVRGEVATVATVIGYGNIHGLVSES